MSPLQHLLFLLLACSSVASLAATARQLPPLETRLRSSLAAADDEGGLVDCWNAMMELRACTNEIVLFFINGESYLTIPCCRAIRLITHKCWPSMLVTLGFTAEEGDILRGYCDAETGPPSGETAPPVPAPSGLAARFVGEVVG